MRSTRDLIRELETESEKFTRTALVVGFENRTEFVWANEENKLSNLNSFVKDGGEPVGLAGITINDGSAVFYSRPLEEFKAESWVNDYLEALFGIIKASFLATGKASSMDLGSGWIN